jgi:hypothetical protein
MVENVKPRMHPFNVDHWAQMTLLNIGHGQALLLDGQQAKANPASHGMHPYIACTHKGVAWNVCAALMHCMCVLSTCI